MIENIYINESLPEYQNLVITDKNRGYVKVFNNGKWKTDNLNIINLVLNSIVEHSKSILDELYDMTNTLYVTALDIYRPGDFVNASPVAETLPMVTMEPIPQFGGSGYDDMMQRPLLGGGQPINFAPVIKIMNGGSDFSTDGQADIVGGNPGMNSPLTSTLSPDIQVKQMGGSSIPEEKEKKEEKEKTGGGGLWDMGKVLIKKIGL